MTFVHLHTHSEYSLLDGANRIDDLVRRAVELGMPALALTDHGNLHGAWEFQEKARARGIKPIIGCEAYVAYGDRRSRKMEEGAPAHYAHLVLLAENETGYSNLIRLSSIGYTEGFYRRPRVDHEVLERYAEGIICLSACLAGEVARYLQHERYDDAKRAAEWHAGVFKDRGLMEADPHLLVEGIGIAARAIGAHTAYLYINGQADLSSARMQAALDQAEELGVVGSEAGLRVEIRRGAGGYVCGEETVILESIEGRRAVPRLRPPFPTERGLWGRPTVINNVETLCNLPDLFRFGVDWFRDVGSADAPGTKLISLSGCVPRPGLIEVPMGASVAEILRVGGLADPAAALTGVVAGGPSGGLLPPDRFDVAIGPGLIDEAGAVLGSGGIVAFDDRFPVAEVVQVEADYNARESCGKCTPCREGGERLADALRRLRDPAGQTVARADIEELIPLLRDASLCGLGQMAPAPVTSALAHFEAALTSPLESPV